MIDQSLNSISVLIPVYKPTEQMNTIIEELCTCGFLQVIVVDDGSGKKYTHVFDAVQNAGATVLRHAIHLGKGRALKSAINHYLAYTDDEAGVVIADGRYSAKDVVRVAQQLLISQENMVLGVNKYADDTTSGMGEAISKGLFRIISGKKIMDTQTGLRGLPYGALEKIMQIKGERDEYEMNILMELKSLELDIKEVEVAADAQVGEGGYAAVKASRRIYRLILAFGGSSLFAFMVDFILYTYIILTFGVAFVLVAVVGARVVSSLVNFAINRKIMLSGSHGGGKVWVHLLKYYILAVCILGANYALINLFLGIGIDPVTAKIITECILFPVSFIVQKRVVFK